MVAFVAVEYRAGDGAVVNLRNLRSRHRSAIMGSGFLLAAANQAFVSDLQSGSKATLLRDVGMCGTKADQ